MTNLAEQMEFDELFLEAASVVCTESDHIVVQVGARERTAHRALMCLVEPQVGDRVMLGSSPRQTYVLGVLARSGSKPAHLSVDTDLEVRLPNGRFAVSSQHGIDMTTAGDASVTASRCSLRALEGNLIVDRLRMLGSHVACELGKLNLVARHVDSFVERVRERVKRSYRFVTEFDQLRAEHIDHRAKQTARVHAENTVITADRLAKIDGDQVHIG